MNESDRLPKTSIKKQEFESSETPFGTLVRQLIGNNVIRTVQELDKLKEKYEHQSDFIDDVVIELSSTQFLMILS